MHVALDCFDQAIRLEPTYLWAWYARGMAHQRMNWPSQAIADFETCISATGITMQSGVEGQALEDARFLNHKAKLWRTECRMQMLAFEKARDEYRELLGGEGSNEWNLGTKIAETYLRERDFVSALRTYEDMLSVPEIADYHGAYTTLGYIEGLLENPAKAHLRLQEALQRERQPTLYPRLWLHILAPDEQKADALDQLKRFVTHPPGDLNDWDLQLGQFMGGDLPLEDFQNAAAMEFTRRKVAAVPLDDLMCEVWFYVGLHLERQGSTDEAVEAYKQSLAFRPRTFKWEWAYARLHYAKLVRTPKELPSGLPNNSPPRTHIFRHTAEPGYEGLILGDNAECGGADSILEELRRMGPKGDLLLSVSRGGIPRTEVIGVPIPPTAESQAPPKAPAEPK
ncbi:MAG: hypothetical protein P1V35_02210 [Planctomycetota bacterium]|nr:hypothetical protein [Planctomycetota bacterium]